MLGAHGRQPTYHKSLPHTNHSLRIGSAFLHIFNDSIRDAYACDTRRDSGHFFILRAINDYLDFSGTTATTAPQKHLLLPTHSFILHI